MKTKHIVYGLIALILLVIVGRMATNSIGRIKGKIEKQERIIEAERLATAELKGKLGEQKREKEKLLENIRVLESQEPKVIIKAVEKIKTVTVDRVEYVPKIEYRNLYDQCQFSLRIREKYKEYIDFSLAYNVTAENLISHMETIQGAQDAKISLLEKINDRLSRKRFLDRICLIIGPTFSAPLAIPIKPVLGFGVSIGYRIIK